MTGEEKGMTESREEKSMGAGKEGGENRSTERAKEECRSMENTDREHGSMGNAGAQDRGEDLPEWKEAAAPRRERRLCREDYGMAVILLIAAWVYVRGHSVFGGCWLPLFTLLFASAGLYRFRALKQRKGEKKTMTPEGQGGFIFLVLGGCWFLVKYIPGLWGWERQGITPYMGLFLHCVGVYWILTIGGARLREKLDESAALDILRGFFVIPLTHFDTLFAMAAAAIKRWKRQKGKGDPEKREKLLQGGAGLLMSIPVVLLLFQILRAADESFERFTGSFGRLWGNFMSAVFGELCLSRMMWNLAVFFMACYFTGLFYGAFCGKTVKACDRAEHERKEAFTLPAPFLLSFSGAVCGLYLVFFLVKAADVLEKAMAGPGNFVYSEYARQGFFELQLIAVINFLLFWFIKGFMPEERPAFRRMLSLLSVQTLGLVVLAFSKMLLYISAYGFTFLRVFTSWFMLVLFVTFFRLLVFVWRKGNAIGPAVLFACVSFLILAYSNMDAWMGWANGMMGLG